MADYILQAILYYFLLVLTKHKWMIHFNTYMSLKEEKLIFFF